MTEFRWVHINNKEELEAFYLSILSKIRAAAKECGYAIGVHGSLRRDLDLIAVPWIDSPVSKHELAVKIHQAACGIQRQTYQWEAKPRGRTATSFPICWTEWNEPNLGHIDLSVMDTTAPDARVKELREMHSHVCDLLASECEERNRLRKVVAAARDYIEDGSTEFLVILKGALRELDQENK